MRFICIAMNLLTETLIISAGMAGVSAIPLYSATLRKFSGLFYLLGTGALSGILFFDLIPDLFELGGRSSMWYVGVVWFLYSLVHLYHMRQHKKEAAEECVHHEAHDLDAVATELATETPDEEAQVQAEVAEAAEAPHSHYNGNSAFFLLSMIAHCFASGILLVTSGEFSEGLNHSIFLALLAHKLYESLTVASVLIEKQNDRNKSVLSIILYSISLPVGVVLTYVFRSHFTPPVALLATSLAAGTLLGCLIFDFFLPSLPQIRRRWSTAGWIAIGLISAQFLMKTL